MIDYYFEMPQLLRFVVVDIDKPGAPLTEQDLIGQIISSSIAIAHVTLVSRHARALCLSWWLVMCLDSASGLLFITKWRSVTLSEHLDLRSAASSRTTRVKAMVSMWSHSVTHVARSIGALTVLTRIVA